MDNLSLEDAFQLINFYRQRSSELELQVLQLQIKVNNLTNKKDNVEKDNESKKSK